MDPRELLLYGVALPLITTGLLALLLARVLPARWRGAGEALALCAGFLASWLALEGMPTLPPRLAHEWLAVVAVLGVVTAALQAAWPALGALVPAAGCVAALLCVGWPPGWSAGERIVPSAAVLALAGLHRWQLGRAPAAELAWLLPAISGATAAALAASGTVTVGHAAGALACGQTALLVVGRWRAGPATSGDAASFATLLLLAHWLVGAWFNELPYSVLVLLAAAPAAYLLPGAPRRLLGRNARTWLAVLVLAAALGVALWFRFQTGSSGY